MFHAILSVQIFFNELWVKQGMTQCCQAFQFSEMLLTLKTQKCPTIPEAFKQPALYGKISGKIPTTNEMWAIPQNPPKICTNNNPSYLEAS